MFNLRSLLKVLIIISVSAWFTACGGGSSGGGGGSDNEAEASTNCVIGTSKIGACKI